MRNNLASVLLYQISTAAAAAAAAVVLCPMLELIDIGGLVAFGVAVADMLYYSSTLSRCQRSFNVQ